MGTYRKEWVCCGSVTETQAWEPEECPFCTPVAPAEPAAQAVDDLLPERLMRFFLRDLKAQLKALGGFVALGNELGRARDYEDWIAAVERYCARYPDPAAREAGTTAGN